MRILNYKLTANTAVHRRDEQTMIAKIYDGGAVQVVFIAGANVMAAIAR